jgi:hypothetical protein
MPAIAQHLVAVLGTLATVLPLILEIVIPGIRVRAVRGMQRYVEALTGATVGRGRRSGQTDLPVVRGMQTTAPVPTFGMLLTVVPGPVPTAVSGTLATVVLLILGFVQRMFALPRMPQTALPGPVYLGS